MKNKKLVIIIVAIVLLIAIGVGVWYFFIREEETPETNSDDKKNEPRTKEQKNKDALSGIIDVVQDYTLKD